MVQVRWLGDGPESLMQAAELRLGRTPEGEGARPYEVRERLSGRSGEVRIGLAGIGDRNAAEALRGSFVFGDASCLPELPPGEHYWFELVGCRVETSSGETVGTVKEIWETGAHDVLVVEGEDGRRVLLPTAREFLREIDVAGQRVVVDEIPGLLEPV